MLLVVIVLSWLLVLLVHKLSQKESSSEFKIFLFFVGKYIISVFEPCFLPRAMVAIRCQLLRSAVCFHSLRSTVICDLFVALVQSL